MDILLLIDNLNLQYLVNYIFNQFQNSNKIQISRNNIFKLVKLMATN